MRKEFHHEFNKINDAEMIKCVKWIEIFSDTIFVAMYIVIYDDSLELSHIRKQTQSELSQEQPFEISDERKFEPNNQLKSLMAEIIGEDYPKTQTKKRQYHKNARLISLKEFLQLAENRDINKVVPIQR